MRVLVCRRIGLHRSFIHLDRLTKKLTSFPRSAVFYGRMMKKMPGGKNKVRAQRLPVLAGARFPAFHQTTRGANSGAGLPAALPPHRLGVKHPIRAPLPRLQHSSWVG